MESRCAPRLHLWVRIYCPNTSGVGVDEETVCKYIHGQEDPEEVCFVKKLRWFREQGPIFFHDFSRRHLELPLFNR